MCANDCGLHNQNIDKIILFAYLFGWLYYSSVEIKQNKAQTWAGVNTGMAFISTRTITHAIAHASVLTRATTFGTLCTIKFDN